jgi:hypothetical protein
MNDDYWPPLVGPRPQSSRCVRRSNRKARATAPQDHLRTQLPDYHFIRRLSALVLPHFHVPSIANQVPTDHVSEPNRRHLPRPIEPQYSCFAPTPESKSRKHQPKSNPPPGHGVLARPDKRSSQLAKPATADTIQRKPEPTVIPASTLDLHRARRCNRPQLWRISTELEADLAKGDSWPSKFTYPCLDVADAHFCCSMPCACRFKAYDPHSGNIRETGDTSRCTSTVLWFVQAG